MENIFMRLSTAIKVILIAIVYFVIAVSGLQYALQSSNATPLWPASGFAFGIILMGGRSLAPGIFLGAFAANLFVFLVNDTTGVPTATWVSAFIGVGNMAEALTGYYLLNKMIPHGATESIFKKVYPVSCFLVTSLIMCLTSCTIGVTSLWIANIIDPAVFLAVWFTWWTGDVTGIMLITPLIIAWLRSSAFTEKQNTPIWEVMIVIVATAITSGMVFLDWFGPDFIFTRAFIIIPFLVWASIRLAPPLVTGLLLFTAVVTFLGTLKGIGPFVAPSLNQSLLTAALFVSVNSIMALILKAAIIERWDVQMRLRTARDHFESMVKERTRELEEKNQQLERKNQELASFTYAASHDLQEPLRKIHTFSDRILQNEVDNMSEKGKNLFLRIQSASARMKKLIENLFSYLHLEKKEKSFVAIDLNVVLKDVQNELSESIQTEGAIIESCRLPVIKGIHFQFEQLFINLLSNSLKFRKKETALRVVIAAELVTGVILKDFIDQPKEHYHHLSFTDNGIGFSEEYAEKIFEIFQRLHGQSEFAGTGIGLAICKKIIENHNGHIYASSVPGRGTAIHIYLPFDGMPGIDEVVGGESKPVEMSSA